MHRGLPWLKKVSFFLRSFNTRNHFNNLLKFMRFFREFQEIHFRGFRFYDMMHAIVRICKLFKKQRLYNLAS